MYRQQYNYFNDEIEKEYNIQLKDLSKLNTLTVDQEEKYERFQKSTKLINSDCEMNRICRYIESINFNIKSKIRDDSKFDYNSLIDNSIIWNEELYQSILKFIENRMGQVYLNNSSKLKKDNRNAEVKFSMKLSLDKDLFFEDIRNELFSKYSSSKKEICNYLIKIFYEEHKSWSKANLWRICGDIIYENCLEKSEYKINIPILDNEFGNIKFYNDMFSVKCINLLEGDECNEEEL